MDGRKGEKAEDDEGRDQQDGQVHGQVAPVGGKGLGRQGHEGDGAELGAEDAEARRPQGYAAAGLEEVVRALLTAREVDAHAHEGEEVHAQDRVVDRTEGSHRRRAARPHPGRAHARPDLAAGENDRAVPAHGRRGHGSGGRELAEPRPRLRDRVITQHGAAETGVAVEALLEPAGQFNGAVPVGLFSNLLPQPLEGDEVAAFIAAEDEDVVNARGRGRSGHDAARRHAGRRDPGKRDAGERAPRAACRIEGKGVGQELGLFARRGPAAAEEKEVLRRPIALGRAHGQDAGGPGPGGLLAPGKALAPALRQIEGEVVFRG